MKKISFIFAILSSFSSIAQGPPMWSNGGNNVNSGDYVGTNNNQPLIFKTNTVERSRILPSGEFHIGSGGLKINPGTYNASPIGLYMLEVGGNAYVDRSLFVKEYINSLKGLRGPKIDVDSILMDSTRGIYGKTKIFGDVQIQQNLTVNGDATFNGKLTATKGIMFDAANNLGIGFTPATGTTSSVFRFGYSSSLAPLATCINPNINSYPSFVFNGHISATANNGLVNSVLNVFSAPWNGSGFLEVEGTDELGGTNNALFINYFCGRNTAINMGVGGKVSVGNNFEAGFANQDLNITANINAVGGTKIAVGAFSQHAVDGGWNTKIVVNRDGTKAIGVLNGATGTEGFKVYGDGKTQIGIKKLPGSLHPDALLSVSGKIVCQELRVVDPAVWADYVFDKDYKLPSWEETENYFKTNKHLKDIPTTKDVMENGIDIAVTQALLLKKIEEAYLYISEMKREIIELKESNKELLKK